MIVVVIGRTTPHECGDRLYLRKLVRGTISCRGYERVVLVSLSGWSGGSSGAHFYLNQPRKFKKKNVDKITGFDVSDNSSIRFDADEWGLSLEEGFTFAAGKNKKAIKKLAKKDFDFLYDEKKGGLYFNENGAGKGFGNGGIIAILKGAPDLTSGNLDFV